MKMIFLYVIPFTIRTVAHSLQVDLLRTVTLPHLQLFGISDGLELRVCRITINMLRILLKLGFRLKNAVHRQQGVARFSSCVPSLSKSKPSTSLNPARLSEYEE